MIEVTFYNETNPNVILWNSSSNKRLCKFKNGVCKTSDKNVIEKLMNLKLKYNKDEYKLYLEYLKTEESKEEIKKEEGKKEETKKKKNS